MHLRRPETARRSRRPRGLRGGALRRRSRERGRRRDRLHRARLLLPRRRRELWCSPTSVERCVYDLDVYVDAVLEAKRRGLPVKLGLEVDYVPGQRARAAATCSRRTRGTTCSARCTTSTASRSTQEPGLVAALPGRGGLAALLRRAARCGAQRRSSTRSRTRIWSSSSGCGHLPRTWHYQYARPPTRSRRPACCVEVSTAGLHKPVGELYPDRELLAPATRVDPDHARLGRARARRTSAATSTRRSSSRARPATRPSPSSTGAEHRQEPLG